jgi:uncharacterized protein YggU (UPF0235/DUF167 family)
MSSREILRIRIKVIPGATRTGIEWYGDQLKIKVNVAPEKGRANAAVANLLAAKLGIAVSAITIVSGQSSALKTLEIRGVTLAQLQQTIV